MQIPARVRASHWLNPIDPAAYRRVPPALLERIGPARPAPALVEPEPAERAVS